MTTPTRPGWWTATRRGTTTLTCIEIADICGELRAFDEGSNEPLCAFVFRESIADVFAERDALRSRVAELESGPDPYVARAVASLHLRPADRDQESEIEEAIVERSLPESDA
jgi:hypothetical protein